MGKKTTDGDIIWKDRKHWMWFPFSFTSYQMSNERLYEQTGLLHTHYDETLLYRVVDICLERSLGQKIFGTGTIILTVKADSQSEIKLINIKKPLETKKLFSSLIETARNKKGVVGREFYGSRAGHAGHEMGEDIGLMREHLDENDDLHDSGGYDFDHDEDAR